MTNELSFFPSPFKDEDLRSVIKRYHKRSCNKHEIESRRELLNTAANTILPRNIDFLLQRLPYNFKKEDLIFKHTLFPILFPFVNHGKKATLLEDISVIKDAKHSSSLYLNKFVSKELRYCPECKKIDIKKNGEYYARRIHQLERFNFCNIHHINLEDEVGNTIFSVQHDDILLLKPILIEVENILNNERILTMGNELSYRYLAAFFEKSYITRAGKPITYNFIEDMWNNYSAVLSRLGIDPHFLSMHNRIWKMIRLEHKTPHPLLHIIMMKFLKKSIDNFLTDKPTPILSEVPFGTGPWACRNHFCEFYKKPIIERVVLRLLFLSALYADLFI
ncbi:TnsD family Tn7-like transposition protein [Jeotgalibacillus campisalis]|uniref:Uncharacterized protein n=1 Tax=Jeotgalibacillus campisalis TaxID=220754 RepID=A0A0C2VPI4_9BACL|nr:TnsD family Tn7-like transposition protein [Jeotgalibacillus campisalis]KIL50822.1 hypothetical protein KR50_07030 [Jeotgalibacillus campisalis]